MSDNLSGRYERRVPEVRLQQQSPRGPRSAEDRLRHYTKLFKEHGKIISLRPKGQRSIPEMEVISPQALRSQPGGSERNLGRSEPASVATLRRFNASSKEIMGIIDSNVVSEKDLDTFQKILQSVMDIPGPIYKANADQLAKYEQQSEKLLKEFREKYPVPITQDKIDASIRDAWTKIVDEGYQDDIPAALEFTAGEQGNIYDAFTMNISGGDHDREKIADAERQKNMYDAYRMAIRAGNHPMANRIADNLNIGDHEYTEIPIYGSTNQILIRRLKSRLREGATASRLGFRGFDGKIVADIGTDKGTYIPMFNDLRAREVYGIDPNNNAINTAVAEGRLDRDHAISTTIEEAANSLQGKIDVAAVFNLYPRLAQNEGFIQSVKDVLLPNGQVVMTLAEKGTRDNVLLLMKQHFDNVRSQKLWANPFDDSHAYLIIADQKPS
jgi:SAM-dependent methyltransferase